MYVLSAPGLLHVREARGYVHVGLKSPFSEVGKGPGPPSSNDLPEATCSLSV